MRPIRTVVIILLDFVNLILRLDVPVFRHTDIDADGAFIDAIPVQARVRDRLADAIHGKASSARAAANLSFGTILSYIAMANARDGLTEITNLVRDYPAHSVKKRVSEFREVVAVGGGKPHACDNNTLRIVATLHKYLQNQLV